MTKISARFAEVIGKLEAHYGTPRNPKTTDALGLILHENIAYLVTDEKRDAAFDTLRAEVGLRPQDILSAPLEKLATIARIGGIHPQLRARRLKEIAQIVLNDFNGDLLNVFKLPLPEAIKALKIFPSIAEPGAERILLFTKTYPVLALESNGLRVLLRLGFGEGRKNYSASYRSVHEALKDHIGDDCDLLIRAHQLLRQHGKELCRNNNPACQICPLNRSCSYFRIQKAGGIRRKPDR